MCLFWDNIYLNFNLCDFYEGKNFDEMLFV